LLVSVPGVRACAWSPDPWIRAFWLAGTRAGKLAYRAAGGRPLVAPVVVRD
jgi:hypothetical protein